MDEEMLSRLFVFTLGPTNEDQRHTVILDEYISDCVDLARCRMKRLKRVKKVYKIPFCVSTWLDFRQYQSTAALNTCVKFIYLTAVRWSLNLRFFVERSAYFSARS